MGILDRMHRANAEDKDVKEFLKNRFLIGLRRSTNLKL